jgi:hypothetical protein
LTALLGSGAGLAQPAWGLGKHKGLLESEEKDFPFQVEHPLVDFLRPGVPHLGVFEPLGEMEEKTLFVFLEEFYAFLHGRKIRGAGFPFPVTGAAETAFHPYPVADDDSPGIHPLEIFQPMSDRQFFDPLLCCRIHLPSSLLILAAEDTEITEKE